MKFTELLHTEDGSLRASIEFNTLDTLWLNTGTICNLACQGCFMESDPRNDTLLYLTLDDVLPYLNEIRDNEYQTKTIGITGGEPFINPGILEIISECLERNFEVLVLTNAMLPMMKHRSGISDLIKSYGTKLKFRVSVDHYSQSKHELERGSRSWNPMCDGLTYLDFEGASYSVAGRMCWGEDEQTMRNGYHILFSALSLRLSSEDRDDLILFPEMDVEKDVPEIAESCLTSLGVNPSDIMCSNSRMIIKPKKIAQTRVISCTLLPYDKRFDLGRTLSESFKPVHLCSPICSQFCVLGSGKCT